MKVLITGGNGFIARNLAQCLDKTWELTILNSRELNLLAPDVVDDFFQKKQFDAVIHTATYDAAPKHSTKDPAKVLENNLKMFFNLVRCREHFGRMIYFGSGAEFSRHHWFPRMTEDYFDRNVPADQYGFSKYVMTQYTMKSRNIFNLRLFGVFGKYDDWRVRFVSNACGYAVFDRPIPIHQNRRFDFLFVEDLAKVVEWLLKSEPRYQVYNVCSGDVYDFRTVAEKIVNVSGKPLDVEVESDCQGQEYSGDNSRLLQEMPELRLTPIDDAIRIVYNWYDEHKDLLDSSLL